MANYKNSMDIATNNDFVARVEFGMVKAALAISAESTGTANHTNRVAFANQVLRQPDRWAAVLALGVMTDQAVQDDKTVDGNLYNALLSIWNAYAGVA